MATKKTSASKASRKAASKKPKVRVTKKVAPKKVAAKKTVSKKAVTKKSAFKKAVAKKIVAKKTTAKKSPVKKAATKKKAAIKKPVIKAVRKKLASKKVVTKKIAAKKVAAKKIASSKATTKKAVAAKPTLKRVAPVAHKTAATKRVRTPAKTPVLQSHVKLNPPPVVPARRTASVALRAKTANGKLMNPAGAVRTPILPSSVSRRAARSAARGLAPTPLSTSVQETKSRIAVDEPLSEQKLREHIRTAVLYLEAWLRSSGADVSPAVAELAAPAESARAQVWRWLDREARFDDNRMMTAALLEDMLHQEMQLLRDDMGPEIYDAGLFATAAPLFLDSALAPNFEDFPVSAAKLLD